MVKRLIKFLMSLLATAKSIIECAAENFYDDYEIISGYYPLFGDDLKPSDRPSWSNYAANMRGYKRAREHLDDLLRKEDITGFDLYKINSTRDELSRYPGYIEGAARSDLNYYYSNHMRSSMIRTCDQVTILHPMGWKGETKAWKRALSMATAKAINDHHWLGASEWIVPSSSFLAKTICETYFKEDTHFLFKSTLPSEKVYRPDGSWFMTKELEYFDLNRISGYMDEHDLLDNFDEVFKIKVDEDGKLNVVYRLENLIATARHVALMPEYYSGEMFTDEDDGHDEDEDYDFKITDVLWYTSDVKSRVSLDGATLLFTNNSHSSDRKDVPNHLKGAPLYRFPERIYPYAMIIDYLAECEIIDRIEWDRSSQSGITGVIDDTFRGRRIPAAVRYNNVGFDAHRYAMNLEAAIAVLQHPAEVNRRFSKLYLCPKCGAPAPDRDSMERTCRCCGKSFSIFDTDIVGNKDAYSNLEHIFNTVLDSEWENYPSIHWGNLQYEKHIGSLSQYVAFEEYEDEFIDDIYVDNLLNAPRDDRQWAIYSRDPADIIVEREDHFPYIHKGKGLKS